MTSKIKVEIKNLYKVFGATPVQMIDVIKSGASKQELLDNYNHVLGLNDVSLESRHIVANVDRGRDQTTLTWIILHGSASLTMGSGPTRARIHHAGPTRPRSGLLLWSSVQQAPPRP